MTVVEYLDGSRAVLRSSLSAIEEGYNGLALTVTSPKTFKNLEKRKNQWITAIRTGRMNGSVRDIWTDSRPDSIKYDPPAKLSDVILLPE